MIETVCQCGRTVHADVSAIGAAVVCKNCGKPVRIVSGEAVPDELALGDFDARLVVVSGPDLVGETFALGGTVDLTIGKLNDRNIFLAGTMVSRTHARLVRLDFGPSRWKIEDTKSRNGVIINGVKAVEVELRDGDTVQIGEYTLRFAVGFPVSQMPVPPPLPGSIACRGCGVKYPPNTQICITCGIDLKTGRPLVTSKQIDENDIAINANTWLRIISWFVPLGISPIASEAFGTHKPRATWVITGITVVVSAFVYLGTLGNGGRTPPELINLKLWVGDRQAEVSRLEAIRRDPDTLLHKALQRMGSRAADVSQADYDKARADLIERMAQQEQDLGEFHWYQLLTNAFLHAGILHLAGNLVFLLVFGLRVNELIGDLKMAILYPVLAICASGVYAVAEWNQPLRAAIGASGAIMGLAGMYFIFFPVQRVHMAIWIRAGLFTGWRVFYKLFRMPGFWLLVLWIAFNDDLPTLLHVFNLDLSDNVAHAAHLGGFTCGAIIALGLLLARQVDAHGADILSITLGPKAWALIGKPAARSEAPRPIEVTRYPV